MDIATTCNPYVCSPRLAGIAEIAGMEGDKPRLNTIWKFDPMSGEILPTGVPSKLRETICKAAGLSLADFDRQVEERDRILSDLVERDISSIAQVTRVLQAYHTTQ